MRPRKANSLSGDGKLVAPMLLDLSGDVLVPAGGHGDGQAFVFFTGNHPGNLFFKRHENLS